MTQEVFAFDETLTTASGAVYGFRLARGTHGFSSTTNPFAAKSTQGDRSYSDYDVLQALAISDFSGGYGQDRMETPNKYWNGVNIDTRSGALVLGPEAIYVDDVPVGLSCGSFLNYENKDQIGELVWLNILANPKTAAWFDCPSGVNDIKRIWMPLMVDYGWVTLTISIYNNVSSSDGIGEPSALPMRSTTIDRRAISTTGSWVEVVFTPEVSVAPGTRYWIVVEPISTGIGSVNWLTAPTSVAGANCKYYNGSAWVATNNHAIIWFDDGARRPDGGLHLIVGHGEDGIKRVWGWTGNHLYYVDANGNIFPVENGAGSVYATSADIVDACWFQGTGDSHPYLYIALGSSTDMLKFDGNIGSEQWATVTGIKADALAVHDGKLWIANENMIGYSTTGSNIDGTAVACGDKAYKVRRMLSWDNALYIGKQDGLYRATYTGTTITTQMVIDFRSLLSSNNFSFLIEHRGDLIFPIGYGIMRYTRGGVLSSFAAESGADIMIKDRSFYRDACSSVTTLWCVVEGALDGTSGIMAYVDGGWHPILAARRVGDFMRSIVIDPGLYSDLPRLWFGSGMQLGFVNMPLMTQKRYLAKNPQWSESGIWESSWFDGNLRTVEKDWIYLELDLECKGNPQVLVYYRLSTDDEWQYLGTGYSDGKNAFTFPNDTYGLKIQIRLKLQRGVYAGDDVSPRVRALVIKYLERPEVINTHMRTYLLSPSVESRSGAAAMKPIAAQINDLRSLASEKEPLIWRSWYGEQRLVHILRYNATEVRESTEFGHDRGHVIVAVQLQEV